MRSSAEEQRPQKRNKTTAEMICDLGATPKSLSAAIDLRTAYDLHNPCSANAAAPGGSQREMGFVVATSDLVAASPRPPPLRVRSFPCPCSNCFTSPCDDCIIVRT